MTKRKKPEVGTWYAVYWPDSGVWCGEGKRSFRTATLFNSRSEAREGMDDDKSVIVVPVRCRLLTAAKRNKKRTR